MAVYTHLSFTDIATIIADYDVGELKKTEKIIKGVSNSNYLITSEQAKYILTLFEGRTRTDDLPFCFALTDFLHKANFPCPQPIKKKSGDIIGNIKKKPSVLISFLSGYEKDIWQTADSFAAGQILSQLHNITQNFSMKRPNPISLAYWEKLWQACKEKMTHHSTTDIAKWEKNFTAVKQQWANIPNNLPVGICHADFFPDNVFFKTAASHHITGVIDFYFACSDRWSYDLAIAITAWCFTKPNAIFQDDMAQQMLAGYQSNRRLTSDEKKYFLPLMIGAAWRFALTRFYDLHHQKSNYLVKPKDPSFYTTILDWLLQPSNQSRINHLL
ncbi:MAG: homoserine kinase [Alphaproteobacteria bacterium]